MRLYLIGHSYKYAVEQILLTLFPKARPEYPEGKPSGERLELRLSEGGKFITASCALYLGDKIYRGRAAVAKEGLKEPLLRDRHCQRVIKSAVYRAALASGIKRPP